MTFVRPKAAIQPDVRPNWLHSLGAVDEEDGSAMVALARSLRRAGIEWSTVLAARTVLFALFLGLTGFVHSIALLPFQLALGLWLISEAAILLSPLLDRPSSVTPNKRLGISAGLAFASAWTFGAAASLSLGEQPVSLLVATLGPAILAQAVYGRLRGLGLAMAAGACLGQLTIIPDLRLSAPYFAQFIGLALLLVRSHLAANRAALEAQPESGTLTGEQAKALLEDFEQSGRGWFWETDRSGKIAYVSERLADRFGKPARDLVGLPFTALIAARDMDADQNGQRTLSFHFSARTAFADISVCAALDGEERWWSISGQPVITAFGQFMGFRGNGSDLTEMRRSQAEVARLATVDSLTGLANRSQMLATLDQALNAQRGMLGECALFLLDLDRFKEVNDTMGHPAGDALLQQVAQRLLRVIGTTGKVGRIGGDEFKIVLPGMVEVMALAKLADAIIHSISEPYLIEGSQVVIGGSIGIALGPSDGTNSETLIRNADLALYTAKGDGRGQFRFFVPAMHAEAEDRRQLEVELRQAIGQGGLHLEYQPVVCASSERITGFEALIRWNHPTRGEISPAAFIPVAEDAGLIGAIGEWVLRTACSTATKWPAGTRVAVNVSPIQFANPALPNIVMSALANAGLDPERLELEITESVFLADRNNTDGMFAQLKHVGVRLALDDFGTGYSALGYLKTAPFDKIKIDQSFVRGAAIKGSRNAAIVKSIVNLAEALGMETTAEGAETLDELDLIRSLGCSHIQGYVYGRPMSHEATQHLLAENDGHAVAKGHKSSREPRMTMLRTVTLRHGGNRYTARVRNVSTSGALIEGLSDVPAGTEFEVEFSASYTVAGHCRWCQDDRMGIEFETAVNVERVRAGDKAATTPQSITDPVRHPQRRAG